MFIEKGEEPSNFDVWMKANTPKNGQHDAYTTSTIEKLTSLISENPEAMNSKEMKDQILDVVLGPEKHGRLRTYGFGLTSTQVSAIKNQESIIDKKVSVIVESLKERVREELRMELREEMEQMIENALQSRFHQNVQASKEPPTNMHGGTSSRSQQDHEVNAAPQFSSLHGATFPRESHMHSSVKFCETQEPMQETTVKKNKRKTTIPVRKVLPKKKV